MSSLFSYNHENISSNLLDVVRIMTNVSLEVNCYSWKYLISIHAVYTWIYFIVLAFTVYTPQSGEIESILLLALQQNPSYLCLTHRTACHTALSCTSSQTTFLDLAFKSNLLKQTFFYTNYPDFLIIFSIYQCYNFPWLTNNVFLQNYPERYLDNFQLYTNALFCPDWEIMFFDKITQNNIW